ncbi:MAG: hypothetical protein M1829_005107 [Trizodia sp. TS-e1964]|nr:MAG: hypothetical protein M1829_005107 [Trizodia sp. TS-e1964]
MSTTQFGLVASIFTVGGFLGAIGAGPFCTSRGRLLAMKISSLFFILGSALEALAPDLAILSLGRFFSGIGSGAAIVAVPIYISEIAPPNMKGLYGAFTQIMINVGAFITQFTGYFLSHDSWWRFIFAIGGIIGASNLLGLFGVVESPKWLAADRDPLNAARNLQRIRGNGINIEPEINAWKSEHIGAHTSEEEGLLERSEDSHPAENDVVANALPRHRTLGVFEVARIPAYRPALIAVVGVMIAQQLTGINSIVMFSVKILSGLFPRHSALLAVFVSLINVIATLLCSPLADKLGRKFCLLASIAGMGSNALLLAISIINHIPTLSAISTLLFVASFAFGLGPVPFILASELVDQNAVGAIQSWALAANWVSTFIVAQFFPILNHKMGEGRVYFVFAALALGFFLFVSVFVPETRGKKDPDEVWGRERRVD